MWPLKSVHKRVEVFFLQHACVARVRRPICVCKGSVFQCIFYWIRIEMPFETISFYGQSNVYSRWYGPLERPFGQAFGCGLAPRAAGPGPVEAAIRIERKRISVSQTWCACGFARKSSSKRRRLGPSSNSWSGLNVASRATALRFASLRGDVRSLRSLSSAILWFITDYFLNIFILSIRSYRLDKI